MLQYSRVFQTKILQKDNLQAQDEYNQDERKQEDLETVGLNVAQSDTGHMEITEKEHDAWAGYEIVRKKGDP